MTKMVPAVADAVFRKGEKVMNTVAKDLVEREIEKVKRRLQYAKECTAEARAALDDCECAERKGEEWLKFLEAARDGL